MLHATSKAGYIVRAVLFCMAFIGCSFVFTAALGFLPTYITQNKPAGLYHGFMGILAGLAATGLFLRFDKKSFASIGLSFNRNTIPHFFKGAVLGIIVMGLLASSVIYFTHASIELNPNSSLLPFLLASIPTFLLALMEELGFRAYPLEILKNKLGIRIAIIITSLLFALSHLAYGWTVTAALGPAIWGLVFGLAAIYSKGIAMPTGIHYAINLTTAALGEKNNTLSIWTIKQAADSTTNQTGIQWVIVIPHLILLAFAITCIEIYLRRSNACPISLNHASPD